MTAEEDLHSHKDAEVLEFSLAFETESDSSQIELESEKPLDPDNSAEPVNGNGITITLNNSTTHLPRRYGSGEETGQSLGSREAAHRRKASLDQLNSSSMENGVVVTKAIVTIG